MSDAQSLTLPKPTSKSRARRRRPKRPSGPQLYWLFWVLWCCAWAVWSLLTGRVVLTVYWLLPAGLYWRHMQRGVWALPKGELVLMLTWWGGLLALTTAGVPGT